MQVTLRIMQEQDTNAVNQLSSQLGYSLSVSETKEQIETILSTQGNLALVATNNEKIIGWIHAFKTLAIESLPFIEIGGLVVDETYRNKGVGKALINAIKEWCSEQNIYRLRLRTNIKRMDAHEFYKALGFEEIKEQKVFQLNLSPKTGIAIN